MLPESVNAPVIERWEVDLLAEYARHQAITGRGNSATMQGAKTFISRWPNLRSGPLSPSLIDWPRVRRPLRS